MALTDKQARFISEYLIDLNATQAAIRAGYSPKAAQEQGSENLSKPIIQQAIREALQAREQRVEITQDRVLKELSLIAFADMRDYGTIEAGGGFTAKSFDEMPDGASRVIGKIKEKRKILTTSEGNGEELVIESNLEFGHWDKVKALELLGKHLGMWTDKLKVSGEGLDNSVKVQFVGKDDTDRPTA